LEEDKISLNWEIHRVYPSVSVEVIVKWEKWAVYVTHVVKECIVVGKSY
jgi:hypothetical protein